MSEIIKYQYGDLILVEFHRYQALEKELVKLKVIEENRVHEVSDLRQMLKEQKIQNREKRETKKTK